VGITNSICKKVIGIMHIAAIMMKAGGAGLVLPCIDRFRGLIEVLGSTDVRN
jgi:hypothetical protein